MEFRRYRVELLNDSPKDRIIDKLLGMGINNLELKSLFSQSQEDYPGGLAGIIGDDVMNAVCDSNHSLSGLTISVWSADCADAVYGDTAIQRYLSSPEETNADSGIKMKLLEGDLSEISKQFVMPDYRQIQRRDIFAMLRGETSDWTLMEVAFSHGQPRLRFSSAGNRECVILDSNLSPMSIAFEMPNGDVFVFKTRCWLSYGNRYISPRVVKIHGGKPHTIYEFGAEMTSRGYAPQFSHGRDFMIVTEFLSD